MSARTDPHRGARRGLTPLLLALALLGPLGVGPGCAASKERWADVGIEGLSFQNLYHSLIDLMEVEGFHVLHRNPGAGTFLTEWLPGISRREVRGPSRRRVHVRIEEIEDDTSTEEDEGAYLVNLRVEEQIIRKGGMLNTGMRPNDDWEAFPDNFDDAEYLVAKIRAMLADFALPDTTPAPEEYRTDDRGSWR